jgi:hypothetical protein
MGRLDVTPDRLRVRTCPQTRTPVLNPRPRPDYLTAWSQASYRGRAIGTLERWRDHRRELAEKFGRFDRD